MREAKRPELLRPEDVEFSRGHVLFDKDGRVDRLYFPHSSLVSLVTHLSDGGTIETSTRCVQTLGVIGAHPAGHITIPPTVEWSRTVPVQCRVPGLTSLLFAVSRPSRLVWHWSLIWHTKRAVRIASKPGNLWNANQTGWRYRQITPAELIKNIGRNAFVAVPSDRS